MFERLFDIKKKDNEAEAFDEMLEFFKEDIPMDTEMQEEENIKENTVSINYDISFIKDCEPELYKKINNLEDISKDEIPSYMLKDLATAIGEEILKNYKVFKFAHNVLDNTITFNLNVTDKEK